MSPEALNTLVGIVFLLLPGALYTWSYERIAGQWRVHSPDRLLTFFGASAVFHALASPATFWLWRQYWHTGRIRHDGHLPWAAYLVVLAYVVVPAVFGFLVGKATQHRVPFLRRIHERTPPRAWDYLFDPEFDGWIRVKTKAGTWLGGPLDENAWVSTYPSDGDILFTPAAIDADGEFKRNAQGDVQLSTDSQILVRWDEIEYLQVDRV